MTSGEHAAQGEIAQGMREHPARKGVGFNLLVTAVEVGGSIGLFSLARHLGASDVASYLTGSIAPLIGGIMIWVKARKFSGASAAIFAFTALSAVTALIGSTTPKVLLYKDCAATGLIGLLFLASCVLLPRPIVFYMAQRYGTDGTHEGMALFDKIWHMSKGFRNGMYQMSLMWAVVLLAQAAVTALIISRSSYSTGYNYDQILPYVAVGVGIAGSMAFGRSMARQGRAGGAAAGAAAEAHRPQ